MDAKLLAQCIMFHLLSQGVRDGRLDRDEWWDPYTDYLVDAGVDVKAIVEYDTKHGTNFPGDFYAEVD